MLILGIDPGTTAVGYALLENTAGRPKVILANLIKEFENIREKPTNKIFEELCFCILTAKSCLLH